MQSPRIIGSELEQYLAEASKLRLLARHIVDDMQLVEDAVHAALAASTCRQYRDAGHRWRSLQNSVRNTIRQHFRSSAHRVQRERAAARREALPAPDEHAQRFETSKVVREALSSLDEPYRDSLTRHYLWELTPQVIAALDGVPVNTVHQRLRRGRELLREILELRAGGRENLFGLLIPLANAPRAGIARRVRSAPSPLLIRWAMVMAGFHGLGLLLWSKSEPIGYSTASAPTAILHPTSEEFVNPATETENRVALESALDGAGSRHTGGSLATVQRLNLVPISRTVPVVGADLRLRRGEMRNGFAFLADYSGGSVWTVSPAGRVLQQSCTIEYPVDILFRADGARIESCPDATVVLRAPRGHELLRTNVGDAGPWLSGKMKHGPASFFYITASTSGGGLVKTLLDTDLSTVGEWGYTSNESVLSVTTSERFAYTLVRDNLTATVHQFYLGLGVEPSFTGTSMQFDQDLVDIACHGEALILLFESGRLDLVAPQAGIPRLGSNRAPTFASFRLEQPGADHLIVDSQLPLIALVYSKPESSQALFFRLLANREH